MDALKLLYKQELSSAQSIDNQISCLIRGFSDIEIKENDEQALVLYSDPTVILMERKKKQR